MLSILKQDERKIGRQYNWDLVKAQSIIQMVLCHAVMQLSAQHMVNYENDFAYVFVSNILGEYVVPAHAFLFCMGLGLVFSRNSEPKQMLKRSIVLYLLGYVLNFLRYGIYNLGLSIVMGELDSLFWYTIYVQDVFQFAGLALALTALFRWLKVKTPWIVLCSVVMSMVGSVAAFTTTGNIVPDLLLGHFIVTTPTESCFPLFNWYIFVAAGLLFGEIICRVTDLDKFYKRMLWVSGIVMTVYIILTVIFGRYFLTKENSYYAISTAEVLGVLSIDLFIASLYYFVVKAVKKEQIELFIDMSKNLTAIYVIHWCIIGFVDSMICYALEFVFPYWASYLLGFAIFVLSYLLSVRWKKRKIRRLKPAV